MHKFSTRQKSLEVGSVSVSFRPSPSPSPPMPSQGSCGPAAGRALLPPDPPRGQPPPASVPPEYPRSRETATAVPSAIMSLDLVTPPECHRLREDSHCSFVEQIELQNSGTFGCGTIKPCLFKYTIIETWSFLMVVLPGC